MNLEASIASRSFSFTLIPLPFMKQHDSTILTDGTLLGSPSTVPTGVEEAVGILPDDHLPHPTGADVIDANPIARLVFDIPTSQQYHPDWSTQSESRLRLDFTKPPPPWYRNNSQCEPFTYPGTKQYLCSTCRRIDTEQFPEHSSNKHSSNNNEAIYLGSAQEILLGASTCTFCLLVTEALRIEACGVNGSHVRPADEYYMYPWTFKAHYWSPLLRLSKNPKKIENLGQRFASSDGAEQNDIAIRPFKVNVPGHGRMTTPEFLDYAWIKERLAQCDARTTRITHRHSTAIRVIDVDRMCIETLKPGARYVALSYVWGVVKLVRLLKATELKLRQVNALLELLEPLPKTIQDAIEVVRRINERYLWVDALCIRQDDDEDKATQIAYMGKIYQGAVLTVAACSGKDADSGLSGVQPGTRRIRQISCQVGQLTFGTRLPESPSDDFDSVWGTRAWTLQESLLSRRMLRIGDGVASWWCWHTGCYEDENCRHSEFALGQDYGRDWWIFFSAPKAGSLARIKQYCSLDAYACIVSDYTTRNLSFVEDAENAMMGILNHLRAHFLGSFIYGLPDVELLNALMWVPIGASQRTMSKDRVLLFPSWSWLGWKGHAAYPWVVERQFPTSDVGSPLLFKHVPSDTAKDYRFSGSTYRWPSEEAHDNEHSSWKRSEIDPWCFSQPEIETIHPNPLSISSDFKRQFEFLRPGSWCLHFRTVSAQFYLAPIVTHRQEKYDCSHSFLHQRVIDQHGLSVGYIYSPMKSIDQGLSPSYQGNHEFIVLSRASLCSDPTVDSEFLNATDRDFLLRCLLTSRSHTMMPEGSRLESSAEDLHDQAHFDRRVYSDEHPWCLYNVMMVARCGPEVVRLAVGRIHTGAFLVHGALEKECCLS